MSAEAVEAPSPFRGDTLEAARWARAQHEAGRYRDRTPARLAFVWTLVRLGKFETADDALAALDRQQCERLEQRVELSRKAARERVERTELEAFAAMDLRDAKRAQIIETGEDPDESHELRALERLVREKLERARRALFASDVERQLATSTVVQRLLDEVGSTRDKGAVLESFRRVLLSDRAYNEARAAASDGLFRITERVLGAAFRAALSGNVEGILGCETPHAADRAPSVRAMRHTLHEHRGATRAVRPCAVRLRGSRRVTTTGPPDDGGGESEPPSERRRAGALHQDDRRNRAGREWCAGLTGELHLGGSQLHQAAHDVRPTQQHTSTPHGALPRGSYRRDLTRQGGADPETNRAPGGNPGLEARTAVRAKCGVGTRIFARLDRPGKGLVNELDGRRAPP